MAAVSGVGAMVLRGRCGSLAMGGVIAMTHVVHGQFGARIGVGHRGLQAFAHGQRAAGVAAAVHGLGEEGVGVLAAVRLDDHVIGFRHRQANLVDRYRLDVLPVRGDHGELEAGDTEVEVAHRRAVDQAQADALAGPEQAGPVGIRGLAVEQVGVGRAADVGEIGGRHVHLRPGPAVAEGLAPALVGDIVDEIADGATALVVVVGLLLQLGQHARRALVGPVGEKHHIVSLVGERLRLLGIDDQRAVDAELLLEARVAVIPVGPALLDLEAVLVHAVRRDAGEAEAGHAVHVGRQQDAVPVDRGLLRQAVAHAQGHGVTLAPAQQRAGNAAIDGHGGAPAAGEVDAHGVDGQVELAAAEYRRLAGAGQRPDGLAPQPESGEGAAGGEAFDEGAPRAGRVHAGPVHVRCGCAGQTVAAVLSLTIARRI